METKRSIVLSHRSLGERVSPAFSHPRRGLGAAIHLAILAATLARGAAAAAGTQAPQAGGWAGLAAAATAQATGESLAVVAAADGTVRLRCDFQKLAGTVTRQGLWLESTAPGAAAGRFRVLAAAVGREGGPAAALPPDGVATGDSGLARFARPGLVEEYSVNVDGVRQDFLVAGPPAGPGALRLELAVSGARAEAAVGGAQLVLDGSGRKLAYHRLHVVDAAGRELAARMEVTPKSEMGLAVVVADAGAVYPVRIDPTFSDASWSGLGSGMNSGVIALAMSGTNLYAVGDFTKAGGTTVNYLNSSLNLYTI